MPTAVYRTHSEPQIARYAVALARDRGVPATTGQVIYSAQPDARGLWHWWIKAYGGRDVGAFLNSAYLMGGTVQASQDRRHVTVRLTWQAS